MSERIKVNVHSEIGELECVILHTPGREVESMSPANASRALYSDILNLDIAQHEYSSFRGALSRVARVLEVGDLLREAVAKPLARKELLDSLCPKEFPRLRETLDTMPAEELSRQLIEGVPMPKDTLTSFLNDERYAIPPLYNFYFMRDASMSIWNRVLLGRMASPVRYGETRVMETIFRHSDTLQAEVIDPERSQYGSELRIEGGDVHVVRDDILMIGNGLRTTSQGVDFLMEELVAHKLEHPIHLLIQELPQAPESFIHLDMVFTLLDRDRCMCYEPLILKSTQYRTIHIELAPDGKTKIRYETNLVKALNDLGVMVEPIMCGGTEDKWHQEREQWHSGANFVAFGPGKIIGYARNQHTIEALHRGGFEVFTATEVAAGKVDVRTAGRCVVTLDGSELPRGGGGGRCMTMPIARRAVEW